VNTTLKFSGVMEKPVPWNIISVPPANEAPFMPLKESLSKRPIPSRVGTISEAVAVPVDKL
jgi:hypothetical protein